MISGAVAAAVLRHAHHARPVCADKLPTLMTQHTFKDLTRQRAFMRMWFARLFGTTGNQMLMVAVGWQMYELTESAWDLGLVGLYQFLPALLLTLVAGHTADRLHRGRIVAACLLTQATVALALVAATQGWGSAALASLPVGATPWVSRELLLGLSVVLGLARAFQMPAQQALTPVLVPAIMLPRAMAFSSAGMQAAVIGGPALGGVIFVAGATAVYATCALLFATGCLLIARVHYAHAPLPAEPVSVQSMLAGAVFVWQRKALLGAVSLDLFAVLLGGATALLPIFAKDILHVGPWGLGLLRASPAAGALVMSVVLTRWPLERRVGHTMLAAVGLYGACMVCFGLSTSFVLSLIVLAVSGGADMVSVVVRQTLMQLETPDAMRGRVSAVNSVFIGASNQLGEFESGATAAVLGPLGSVVAGGLGTLLVAALWLKWFPSLAHRDRMTEKPPAG
ncbi:MAG: major facilitator transporter [Polaromonas sp.]|jgi:MFS family permease|nr:major facilitator transporter [Polaromonas sp.]